MMLSLSALHVNTQRWQRLSNCVEFHSAVIVEISNMFQSIIGDPTTFRFENTSLTRDVKYTLASCHSFGDCREEARNVSASQEPWRPFFRSVQKHKFGSGRLPLSTSFQSSSVEFRSAFAEEKSKMCLPTRCQGGHLCFPIGRKTHTW